MSSTTAILICVRYYYDVARQKRLKTVELVIDEQDWVPGITFPTMERVLIRVGYGEPSCAKRLKPRGRESVKLTV